MAKIYFDAATQGNPGMSSGAVVIITEETHTVKTYDLPALDNHSAEWETLLRALDLASEMNVDNALIFTDSKLIEDSINQESVKNERFKAYLEKALSYTDTFALMFVKWVPRAQNKEANHHAQQALYKQTKQQKHK